MRMFRVALVGATLLGSSVKFTEGQQLPAPSPPWASQMPEPSRQPSDAQPTAQQEKLRLAARRKRLMEDTDRLLSLATDLKAQVDKSSTTKRFSVDEIKKAGEIEKLAHRVKQQLKG